MADGRGNNRGPGESIGIGPSPPEYSPVATDDLSEEVPASFRFPELAKHSAWRPFTLRAPTLLLFLFTTIGLIAIIEALNYISIRNNALTFADSRQGFSTTQIFCYRYLPQMVIVLYGIGWAAVDLDVKRLEPYLQLSKPGGASAGDSILLHYPFDFLALVPFSAARRGHWNVFASGTALILIFWVVTPLQSSLLTTELVAQEIRTQFTPTAKLQSYSSQAKELDSTFFYSSYCVTWLGQKIDGFMTREFVAIPFKPVDSDYDENDPGNESWTAATRVYQTHVDCVPATIIEPGENDDGAYNFTTNGCSYSLNLLAWSAATRNLKYIGYSNNGSWLYWNLGEPRCMVGGIFLGVWAKSRLPSTKSTDIDVSGIFCRTRYSYADADITVDATNLSITRFSFIGEPKPLTAEDSIIDIDLFEEDFGSGMSKWVSSKHFSVAGPGTQVRYKDWNLWRPTGPVGYAIGLENKTFDDFRDPKIFGDAMNKTHKLLFNYALRSLFRHEDQPQQLNGTRIVRKDGVVVVPAVAHLLAGFLSVVAVCLAGVFFLSYKRRNNLRSDPDTLATKMSLVAESPQLLRDFEGADNCPDISRCIKRRRYKLWGGEDRHRLDAVDSSEATPSGSSHESSAKPHDGRGIRPWELSAGMGVFTTIFSAGLLVLLAVLFWSSQKYSGLPTLSNRRLVVQFIFSFIPTAVATLIEPFWVVVTRYLALYQPWTELNRGHSSSAASLGLKYTNLPPVLIAPRALAGRHYILFLASAIVLASNGLAVAFGGLFGGGAQSVSAVMTFEFPLSASIDTQIKTWAGELEEYLSVTVSYLGSTFAQDAEENWLIALTNLTGTSLPPWIAPELYFLPFEWNTTAGNALDLRSGNTWGFGANLTCKLLVGDVYGQQSWMGRDAWGLKSALNVTIPTANGNEVRCNNRLQWSGSLATGRFAGEYLHGLGASDREDKETKDFCTSLLVMGWNRGSITVADPVPVLNYTLPPIPNYTMDMSTYENTTILCTQQIFSAEFNVVVDNDGLVQRFKRLTPFTYDNSSLFNHSTTITSFKAQLSTIIRTDPYGGLDRAVMHNDQYPRTLPHYFMESTGLGPLCDPSTPPPSFEDAQRRFQDFYSWFAPIVIGQNSESIFRSTTNDGGRKPQTFGQRIFLQNRALMDPAMFYIATALLGFSTLASVVIFSARPKRFLPRLPDTLAAEIGFFYASQALEDTVGTAHMSSAMREGVLAKLGWEYGYGKFMGKDNKVHSGVERMAPINDFKEAS